MKPWSSPFSASSSATLISYADVNVLWLDMRLAMVSCCSRLLEISFLTRVEAAFASSSRALMLACGLDSRARLGRVRAQPARRILDPRILSPLIVGTFTGLPAFQLTQHLVEPGG